MVSKKANHSKIRLIKIAFYLNLGVFLKIPAKFSNVLHELRVEEGESGELVLVEVHHEEFVRRGQVGLLGGELSIEVAHVLAMTLWSKNGNGLEQNFGFYEK